MNRPLLVVAVGSAALAWASAASAQVVYSTGFEDPPFANHSLLVGQDGWVAPPPLSPNAADVATGIHAAGQQAMRVLGRDLEHQDFINEVTAGYYDAIGSYRHALNYDTHGTEIVRVSADIYLRGGQQTPDGNNFFSASVGAPTLLTNGGVGGTGELAISSDGHVYGYSGNDLVPTFLTSAPVTLNAWHNLAVEEDHSARTFTFIVDGASLGTFPFAVPADPDPTADYTNIVLRNSLLAYAAPDTSTLKKQNFAAYYDNVSVVARSATARGVPEPAGAALAVCGAFVFFARKGARRR